MNEATFKMEKIIKEWVISPSSNTLNPSRCLVGLPGRANTAHMMIRLCNEMKLPDTLVVAMEPDGLAWYPQPYAADNQKAAVAGLAVARKSIEHAVQRIESGWGIDRSKIALVGYSAGAVMAIQVAAYAKKSYGAVASLCGAILEPSDLPQCKHPDTSFMLMHNQDDLCFDWQERYLPMKQALMKKKYKVNVLEEKYGGHMPCWLDIRTTGTFIGQKIVDKNWTPPKEEDMFDDQSDT